MSTGSDALEARVVELEIRLAHHERMAEELSMVIAQQGRTMDMMAVRVQRLTERLREAESGWDRSPQDDKPPPHY